MSDAPAAPVAESPSNRRTRQVLGVLVALIWPSGPGHLVIGHKRRAWAWAGAVAGFLLVAELAAVASGNGRFLIAGCAGILAFHVLSAIDVARLEHAHPLPSFGSFMGNFLLLIGALVLFTIPLRLTLIEAFRIPSASMFPALRVGDHIFVNKRVRRYARGDVAVFAYPLDHDTSYIKRVIGLPGDVLEQKFGDLSINGQTIRRTALDEPCTMNDGGSCTLYEESFEGHTWRVAGETRDFEPVTVPPGHYWVLGDNRANSSDSRVWGFVDQDLMRGKALTIWQSQKADGSFDWSRFNAPVR